MSSLQLLDKTRMLNRLLHNNDSSKFIFNDVCEVLRDILDSNVLVISKKGKLLGTGFRRDIERIEEPLKNKVGEFIDESLNRRLLGILSTKENVKLLTLGFAQNESDNNSVLITPIDIAGERLGTLFFYKNDINNEYGIDDIILCEYGAAVVGLEMIRAVTDENAEEMRRVRDVRAALSTMSATESEAIRHIFEELQGMEGVLVASRIADKAGITRSVIVNALRKLESAGVIESKSSGMKGTYIKVLNPVVFDELKT
ncbi:MAG: GTP-sensing pleiotropic transcriptional regulator CodY [Lachnospiraceae bacterium]|nr:GTP-sensing pleiotropic transcriptional regulator CodY [Lachnospiraceae bacterium]